MDILTKIMQVKMKEVAAQQQRLSIEDLERSFYFENICINAKESITQGSGVIAEYKRKSPSKDIINDTISVEEVAKGYEVAKASAMSVLTDVSFFGGGNEYLLRARKSVNLPLLRKDFIFSEYQILEAKSIGADFILLIAAVLSKKEIRNLSNFAQSLGLQVLLEVHNLEELEKSICPSLDIIGVNNRNLKTFQVSLETSLHLVDAIPNDFVKISESGISNIDSIKTLKKAGFQGFLIGEHFMKSDNPSKTALEFIEGI